MNGSGVHTVDATNFFDLTIQNADTIRSTGNLDIDDDLRVSNGVVFDPDDDNHTIADDFENDGVLALGTGSITFDGAEWQTIHSNHSGSAPGVWNFNDLIISGTGSGVGVYDTLSINGNLSIQSRYLALRDYAITNPSTGIINGNGGVFSINSNAALYIRTSRTNGAHGADDNFPSGFNTVNLANGSVSCLVYYQSDANQIVRTTDGDGDPIQYGRLRLQRYSSSGNPTKYLAGHIDVDQYIYIGEMAAFDADGYNINLWGYWYNYGSFTHSFRTVTFDGDYQQITGNASTTFYNLILSGSNGKVLNINTTVNNNLIIQSGVTYLNLRNYTLTGSGSFILGDNVTLYVRGGDNFPSSFGTYSLSSSSITRYDGAGFAQTVKSSPAYGCLYVGNGGVKTLDGGSLTVNGYLTISGASTTFDIDNTTNNGYIAGELL
jgi:hypothetical protein